MQSGHTLGDVGLPPWAASAGCPSIYPYWAEVHGLQGAGEYNGRVGRVMKPPNDNGRHVVEIDAGAGELPRRGSQSQTLKSILIKKANLHALASLVPGMLLAVPAAHSMQVLLSDAPCRGLYVPDGQR